MAKSGPPWTRTVPSSSRAFSSAIAAPRSPPKPPLRGGEQIRAFYRALLADLEITRFARLRRWYGEDHLADESILHAIARGRPFGLEGRGRAVQIRILHIFDFANGRIHRESAWLDLPALQQQLAT